MGQRSEGRPALHQATVIQALRSVELSEQVEKILGDIFAQHVVIDRAQRAADGSAAIARVFLSGTFRPALALRPSALLVPLNLSSPSSASICATSSSNFYAAHSQRPPDEVPGWQTHLLPPPREPFNGELTVPNWERKPNRQSFVPPLANSGRRVLRRYYGASNRRSTGLHRFAVPAQNGGETIIRSLRGVTVYVAWPGTRTASALPSPLCRALTGSQAHGDAFVRATLEAIVAKPDEFPRDVDPRLGLYRTFHAIWSTANIEEGEEPSTGIGGAEGIAQARLVADHAAVAPGAAADQPRRLFQRGHRLSDRASPEDVDSLVAEAMAEIERQTHADVLIIEDEPIIAMDIEIDRPRPRPQCHRRRGDPRRSGSPRRASRRRAGAGRHPAGRRQSGIDAVKDILAEFSVPVIFITAFPGAAADRDPARADLPDHQAVPALDGEGGDQPGAVLRRGDGSPADLSAGFMVPLGNRRGPRRWGWKTFF